MIIYADLLFALNTVLNFLLLSGTGRFAAREARFIRRLLSAAFGGAYALICTRFPILSLLPMQLLFAFGMLILCFGWGRQLFRLGLWFFLLSAAYAGVVLLLSRLFRTGVYLIGGSVVYPVRFGTLVLTAGLCYAVSAVLLERLGHSAGIDALVPATICVRGVRVRITALRDTGNALHEPISGKPAFVLQQRVAEKLLPELGSADPRDPGSAFIALSGILPGARLIPYRTVGAAGMLLAVRSDWVLVGTKRYDGAYLAIAPSTDSGEPFELIAGGK